MKTERFPEFIRDAILPKAQGRLEYRCLGCGRRYGIDALRYTCPDCRNVLLLEDPDAERLKEVSGDRWREIFDYRKMLTLPALRGIYRYHEFIGPVLPLGDIVCLGEGHTPMIEANRPLQAQVGCRFFFKNDGQNPSASFKDRGMASALSYINHLINSGRVENVLAVCASTGDTSAAAALYAAYLQPKIKSAVLLPHKKVTAQQLAQPLGSGARVYEIPGVFDDCMKVVEALSETCPVALLNSKNAWRILGQESYSYEIAQDFEYDLAGKVVIVPIGNAGNITAVMRGFLKFLAAGVIETLPGVIGVQSRHADPVFRYYQETDPARRHFEPMAVKPSVAQAAMIGNPVSMPRVIELVGRYNAAAGREAVAVVEVEEQAIMDWQLRANRNGHIACTHGGETLAGLVRALELGIVSPKDTVVLDSTAHALKFADFQTRYFAGELPPEYQIVPDERLINAPQLVKPPGVTHYPTAERPLAGEELADYVEAVAGHIAADLGF